MTSDTEKQDFLTEFQHRAREDDSQRERLPRRIKSLTSLRGLRKLAVGGLGIVYVYRDGRLRRKVAIKVAKKAVLEAGDKHRRFVREAEITAGLQHPAIPAIYGSGRLSDGRPYYVMRLLNGQSFRSCIRDFHACQTKSFDRGNASFTNLLRCLIRACDAIVFAHGQGIIHRDLKPDNIVVEPGNLTFVVDWGLAKRIEADESDDKDAPQSKALSPGNSDTDATQMGQCIGTRGYMSPEQAIGDVSRHDRQTDVFGLGTTLLEILSGRPLMQEHGIGEVIDANCFAVPESLLDDAPPELVSVCQRAITFDKSGRYADVGMLRDDIESWISGQPVWAHRERYDWQAKLNRWAQQHGRTLRWLILLSATVVLGAAGSLAVLSRAYDRERDALISEQRVNTMLLDTLADTSRMMIDDEVLAQPAMQPLRLRLLNQLSQQYQRWSFEEPTTAAQCERGLRGLLQLATIQQATGASQEAFEAVQQAQQLWDRSHHLLADNIRMAIYPQLMRLKTELMTALGDLDFSLDPCDQAIAFLDTMPASISRDRERALTLYVYGSALYSHSNVQPTSVERIACLRRSQDLFRQSANLRQANLRSKALPLDRLEYARSLGSLALLTHKLSQPREALRWYAMAIDELETLQQTDDPTIVNSAIDIYVTLCFNRGMSFAGLHEFQQAADTYHAGLEACQARCVANPLVLRHRESLANGYGNLADLHEDWKVYSLNDASTAEYHLRKEVEYRQLAIQESQDLIKENVAVAVHHSRVCLHTIRMCYALHLLGEDDEVAVVFGPLIKQYSQPENVEALNPYQAFRAAACYCILASKSKDQTLAADCLKAAARQIKTCVDDEAFFKIDRFRRTFQEDDAFSQLRTIVKLEQLK